MDEACANGAALEIPLIAKSIDFGSITVDCTGVLDTGRVDGVDADLLVRPFQWKGVEATVRAFSRGALHNELGMQAVELAGADFDGDADGVANEVSIPDLTAMAVNLGGQPRPVTELELNALRLRLELGHSALAEELDLPTLSRDTVRSIERGPAPVAKVKSARRRRR